MVQWLSHLMIMSEMVSREDESFSIPKIHKWVDNIEYMLNDWSYESVFVHFGVEEVSELTAEDIEEIEDFIASSEDSWYDWVLMGLKNLVNEWENLDEHD